MGIWQLIRYIFRNSLNSYKNSFRMSLFGYFWAIFQPLALVAIYSLVFGHIVKTKLGVLGEYDYAVFVSTALLPWLVFASGVQSGTSAIVSHSNYIKKIPMPIFVYPAKASIVFCSCKSVNWSGKSSNTTGRYLILARRRAMPVAKMRRWSCAMRRLGTSGALCSVFAPRRDSSRRPASHNSS